MDALKLEYDGYIASKQYAKAGAIDERISSIQEQLERMPPEEQKEAVEATKKSKNEAVFESRGELKEKLLAMESEIIAKTKCKDFAGAAEIQAQV